MKRLKISCQKHINRQSFIVIQEHINLANYMKTCSFLHAHFTETMKVVENLEKKFLVNSSFIEKTYVVGAHWNCPYEAIPMCTNNICRGK